MRATVNMENDCYIDCCVGCQLHTYYDIVKINGSCRLEEDIDQIYSEWKTKRDLIEDVIHIVLVVAGCSGLFSYIPMIIVFQKPDFSGPSYIYHKSIIAMEIAHMAVMAQAGFTQVLHLPKTYQYVYYHDVLRELWIIGDWMKLSTSVLTSFLSMERFFAILSPKRFKVINKPQFAWSCVCASMLAGMLHLVPSFVREVVHVRTADNSSIWLAASKTGRDVDHVGGDQVVNFMIFSIKIFSCVATAAFSVGVAVGLVLHSKRGSSMTQSAQARWMETRRLSILQLVIAALQVFDHGTWVAFNVLYDSRPSPHFQETVSAGVVVQRCWPLLWTVACQELSGVLDHALRLPLYLIGAKKFKERFVLLFKNGNGRRITSACSKTFPVKAALAQTEAGNATLVSWRKVAVDKCAKSVP